MKNVQQQSENVSNKMHIYPSGHQSSSSSSNLSDSQVPSQRLKAILDNDLFRKYLAKVSAHLKGHQFTSNFSVLQNSAAGMKKLHSSDQFNNSLHIGELKSKNPCNESTEDSITFSLYDSFKPYQSSLLMSAGTRTEPNRGEHTSLYDMHLSDHQYRMKGVHIPSFQEFKRIKEFIKNQDVCIPGSYENSQATSESTLEELNSLKDEIVSLNESWNKNAERHSGSRTNLVESLHLNSSNFVKSPMKYALKQSISDLKINYHNNPVYTQSNFRAENTKQDEIKKHLFNSRPQIKTKCLVQILTKEGKLAEKNDYLLGEAGHKGMLCQYCTETFIDNDQAVELICEGCIRKRVERRETILEIVTSEENYGRDLKILLEEFYMPMKAAGLLTCEQLGQIFLNLEELIDVNECFNHQLHDALKAAAQQNDEELLMVAIGQLILKSSDIFTVFEKYCINQTRAILLLEQLEKEKEVLRVFLQVSQAENSLLRRMNLKSFLMVPVQRIMKYPLLLNRLYKTTPVFHHDYETIQKARLEIERILDDINLKSKGTGTLKLKRKRSDPRRHSSDKYDLVKIALEVLGWNRSEVSDILVSMLQYTQPQDHFWPAKKCRNLKFSPVYAVLLTLGEPHHEPEVEKNLLFPKTTVMRQAALVLLREKSGRYHSVREPLFLDKCVITADPEYEEVFEVQDWNRDAFLFKAGDSKETSQWVQQLKLQSKNLGVWWRRRNALPNIMIKNLG